MATSRLAPLLIALTAALAALALGGCGSDEGSDQGESAQALLTRAASAPIQSTRFRLHVGADIVGLPVLGGPFAIDVRGVAKPNGPKTPPTVNAVVSFNGGGQSFPLRVAVVADNAYVTFMDQSYYALERPLPGGASARPAPVSLAQLGLRPARWFSAARVADGEPVDGQSTRRVTGTVDVHELLADLASASSSPVVTALQSAVESAGIDLPARSPKNVDHAASAVKQLTVLVDVDEHGAIRRIAGRLVFEVPRGTKAAGIESGRIVFALTLDKVGGVAVTPTAPEALSGSIARMLRSVALLFGFEDPAASR